MIEANCGRVYVGKAAPSSGGGGGDYIPTSQKGAANGVATLDSNTLIPAAQIPVDNDTITVENGKIKANGGSAPADAYTRTNLLGGKGIKITSGTPSIIKAYSSSGAYAYTSSVPALSTANSWSIKKVFAYNGETNTQWIIGNIDGEYSGPQLIIYNDGDMKFGCYMSSLGSSFDIAAVGVQIPSFTLTEGHKYEVTLYYSNVTGYVLVCIDLTTNTTYTWAINPTTTHINCTSALYFLNNHYSETTLAENYFRGTDYWSDTKVIIDGITWFDGATAVAGTDFVNEGLTFQTEGGTGEGTYLINNEELLEEWEKPASWVDLRSGALPNSVYFLAAHSADYATYPTLTVYAEVSDSSTYDVYVDGIKKASAVSSGAATTLSWETLALATGYDVTYPAALRTHIVRITPTEGTKTITRINNNDGNATVMTGVLWAHFTTENYMNLRYAFLNLSHLEAVTAKSDMLNVANIYQSFNGCSELKTVPTFNGKNQQYIDGQSAFLGCAKLQKISFEDFTTYRACSGMFNGCSALKKISTKNSVIKMWDSVFNGCAKLESLPNLENGAATTMNSLLASCTSLKETVLDLSGETSLTKLSIGATSSKRVDGLKGVIVSSSAPFSASPFVDVSYTGLERPALVALFDSLPTVSDSQVCTVTGCTGAADLTADDIAIATAKGWTVTR